MSKLKQLALKPPHPGDFVRTEVLQELGLSISAAASILGIRRATLSDFLNQKSALSPELALRLEKAFGVGMELLLRMQAWHDAARMRQQGAQIQVQRYIPPAA